MLARLLFAKATVDATAAATIWGTATEKAIAEQATAYALDLAKSGLYQGMEHEVLVQIAREEVMSQIAMRYVVLSRIGMVFGSLPGALTLIALGFAFGWLYVWIKGDYLYQWLQQSPFGDKSKPPEKSDIEYVASLKHVLYRPKAELTRVDNTFNQFDLTIVYPQFDAEHLQVELMLTANTELVSPLPSILGTDEEKLLRRRIKHYPVDFKMTYTTFDEQGQLRESKYRLTVADLAKEKQSFFTSGVEQRKFVLQAGFKLNCGDGIVLPPADVGNGLYQLKPIELTLTRSIYDLL